MATLTYVKGLPTPVDELNAISFTEFEMFLNAYCPVFHKAANQRKRSSLRNDETCTAEFFLSRFVNYW